MKKTSKRILSFALTLAAAAAFALGAFAADNTASTVTYDASKNLQVTGSDVNFTDLLPGQQRKQTITLTNNSGATADFFLDVSVLESMENAASSGSASVTAYTLGLSVTDPYTGNPTSATGTNVIFGGNGNSGTVGGNGSNGLFDFNAAVTLSGSSTAASSGTAGNWLNVAHLENGQSATIAFTVAIDRNATGNSYQTQLAKVKFDIRAQDTVTNTTTVTTTTTEVRRIIQRVRTGDTAPLLMLCAVLAVGVVLIVLLIGRGRRRRREEQKH